MRRTVDAQTELLEVLQAMHPEASRNTLRRMLDTGRVQVNGQTERRAKHVVSPGDVVSVRPQVKKASEPDRLGRGARVLYEDAAIIAAEKPQGLLTIATDRGGEDTLYDRLFEREKERGGRVFIVHRLDRPTSGVMLFAKDEEVKERMQAAFAAKMVERVYHVLVEGRIGPDAGTVDERLAESPSLQVYITPSEKHGRAATTHWKVLERGTHYSLVEATLGTGRRHQIRVHMAHLGHPVVGDREHGARTDPLGRLGLHAHRLEFDHPMSGERIRVESETPPSFPRALAEDPESSVMRTPRRHPHGKKKKGKR